MADLRVITFPIKRGTARRLGIRQPKPLASPHPEGGYYASTFYPMPAASRATMEMFRAAASPEWGFDAGIHRAVHRMDVAGYRPLPQPTEPEAYIPGSDSP